LYVFIVEAFGYLLEVARIQGKVWSILLLDGLDMVNNHFVDDSLLFVRAEQSSLDGAFYFGCFLLSVE